MAETDAAAAKRWTVTGQPSVIRGIVVPATNARRRAMPDAGSFEDRLIAEMRANDGEVISGPLAGHPLLIMTSRGAKSGSPRRAILTFHRDGGDYVVAGTASGSTTDPDWLHNVAADPDVTIREPALRCDRDDRRRLRARSALGRPCPGPPVVRRLPGADRTGHPDGAPYANEGCLIPRARSRGSGSRCHDSGT
jgi:deazaflavin-dependent oxidoreductase (nitroreductase family)